MANPFDDLMSALEVIPDLDSENISFLLLPFGTNSFRLTLDNTQVQNPFGSIPQTTK